MERRVANPSPNMAGLARRTAVGWVEEEVNRWVRCRIKNELWTPGPIPQFPTIIRKNELMRRIGLSHVRIWQLEKENKFPRRVRLTGEAGDATG